LKDWAREAGGHRFQRVPPTEQRGRVHTSTVTVAVFASERPAVEIDLSQVKLEWFSGTGAGGQHRNKHQNSCRVLHVPTGISAKAECRSRENSQAEAMAELEKRVRSHLDGEAVGAEAVDRRAQVGSGMRGDKVRTYRLQDDTVMDHRTERRASWKKVQRGDFTGLA